MDSRGSVRKYYPFLSDMTREFLNSLQEGCKNFREFYVKLIDYLLTEKTTKEELVQFAGFQILEMRDIQCGFEIYVERSRCRSKYPRFHQGRNEHGRNCCRDWPQILFLGTARNSGDTMLKCTVFESPRSENKHGNSGTMNN